VRRVGVLASGRGSNLRALHAATKDGVLKGSAEIVVIASDKPGAGALVFANEVGIPSIAQPKDGLAREAWDAAMVEKLASYKLDFVVLAGFMRVLSPVFVKSYPGRIVNVHPADTREHKGLGGYAFAFERKMPETKVTVHVVDDGLDTGPILAQRAVDLRGAETLEEVERRGLAVEHALYAETLRDLFRGLRSHEGKRE
jgi:phosphoribosylglycinamide formyltransferase 1